MQVFLEKIYSMARVSIDLFPIRFNNYRLLMEGAKHVLMERAMFASFELIV